MAKTGFPFDAGSGATVREADWTKMAKGWLGTGVLPNQLNALQVYADSSGMQVKVKSGRAWVEGHFFESDAEETVAIGASDPTNPRIDRVIVRVNWTANTVDLAVLQGTAAASPVAPSLTTSSAVWEISLAQVLVSAAVVTIAATKITDERTYAANANEPYALRAVNLLTNPGFEVWQRGTSFAAMAANAYGPDRWYFSKGGTSALTIAQEATVIETGSRFSAKLTYTHNAASYLSQDVLSGVDGLALRGRVVTFTVRVRCDTAAAVRLRLGGGVTAQVFSSYHTGGSAWETLTVTATVAVTETTLNCQLEMSATCIVYLDNASLVVGSISMDYVPLHPAEDLARCLRYYEVWGGLDATERVAMAQAWSTTRSNGVLQFRAIKAVTPSVTKSAAGDFVTADAAAVGKTITVLSFTEITTRSCELDATVASGLVAGNASQIYAAGTTAARIIVEANP